MATIIVIGNLGQDPKPYETNGRRYWRFSIAEKRRSGEVEITDWYTCFMDDVSEGMAKYLVKGARVQVIGKITASIYQAPTGAAIDRRVNVSDLTLLSSQVNKPGTEAETAGVAGVASENGNESDIPF